MPSDLVAIVRIWVFLTHVGSKRKLRCPYIILHLDQQLFCLFSFRFQHAEFLTCKIHIE